MKILILISPTFDFYKKVITTKENKDKVFLIDKTKRNFFKDTEFRILLSKKLIDEIIYKIILENKNYHADYYIYFLNNVELLGLTYGYLMRPGMIGFVGLNKENKKKLMTSNYRKVDLLIIKKKPLGFIDFNKKIPDYEQTFFEMLLKMFDKIGYSSYLVPFLDKSKKNANFTPYYLKKTISEIEIPNEDLSLVKKIDNIYRTGKKLTLLIDLSYFAKCHNGTMEYGKEIFKAIIGNLDRSRFKSVNVLGNRSSLEFHKIPLLYHINDDTKKKFDVCFRPAQFYDKKSIDRVKKLSKFYVITQQDVIGNRCLYINNNEVQAIQKKSLLFSDGIIFISEYAKKDIQTFFKLENIDLNSRVIYHGVKKLKKFNLNQSASVSKMFLIVGNCKHDHKLIKPTLSIIKRYLKRHNCNYKFIFLSDLSKEKELPTEIRYYPHNLDDSKVEELYAQSNGIIFPSVYEGFGLPILHALNNYKKILLADNSLNNELGSFFGNSNFILFKNLYDLKIKLHNFINDNHIDKVQYTPLRRWDDVAIETLNFLFKITE